MKKYLFGILFLFLIACFESIDVEDLPKLNGYWQIEKVIFPDKSSKTYEVSTTLDFIQFEETNGYRKKVQPALDGTFDTSDDAVSFDVMRLDRGIFLLYSNAAESWEEELLHIDDNSFSVKNEAGIVYHYKRYEPTKLGDE